MSMTACAISNTRMAPPIAVFGREEAAHRRDDRNHRDRADDQAEDRSDVAAHVHDRAEQRHEHVREQAPRRGNQNRFAERVLGAGDTAPLARVRNAQQGAHALVGLGADGCRRGRGHRTPTLRARFETCRIPDSR